ncbi:MAG TPA: hypothetical protein DCS07_05890 [Bdellovibrionales bacterium]|nr:hypothetical protein [Bdellovibrionales bacterium]
MHNKHQDELMASESPTINFYLKPGRLSDILALIQILAYDKLAKRTHDGLKAQLRRDPLTASTWTDIGQQHPELFRVLEAEKHSSGQKTVALIARFVQEGILPDNANEPPKSSPLSPDQTNNLINLAIQLHDREVQRRDRWKTVIVPMVVAIIAAGASIVGAIISTSKNESIVKNSISESTRNSTATQNQESEKSDLAIPEEQAIIEKQKNKEAGSSSNSKTVPNKS